MAQKTIVVADSSKVGRQLPERFCTWSEITAVIIDRPTDDERRRIIQTLPRRRLVYSSDEVFLT